MKIPVFEGSSTAIVTPFRDGKVDYKKLSELTDCDVEDIEELVGELADEYKDRGINLLVFDDQCQFCSSEKYKDAVNNFLGLNKTAAL